MNHVLPIRLVSADELPGPDTRTKAEAVAYARTDPRYASMLLVAAETGWPEAYHHDLYHHDRQTLRESAGEMIFILRDNGTHLYPTLCDASDAHWARGAISYHSGDHKLNTYGDKDRRPKFYRVWAGGEIQEIGWRAAYGLIRVAGAEEVTHA